MCGAQVLGRIEAAWQAIDPVPDPEIPVLTLRDLGIVREVRLDEEGALEVVLTPTYSGCPATEVISASVAEALEAAGLAPFAVTLRRAPAWTTDWISEQGRQRLREYGIAPPGPVASLTNRRRAMSGFDRPSVSAVATSHSRCDSPRTERLSAFGSTACKSLWRCLACREPFEHFKPI